MTSSYRLLIDGALVDGASTLDVIDPATSRPFVACARANPAQLDQAVDAAGRAFSTWSRRPVGERRAYLERLADAMEARFVDFATLLTRELGKPLGQAQFEIGGTIAALRHFAAMDVKTSILREDADARIIEHRTALGVVAAITPWNFPMILLMLKVAPALITGNTVIAKPAPSTPLTTLLLGEVAADILPPGVFSTIVDDNDLGPLITAHPGIAKISFTGSTQTGKRVMASAAGTLKRLTLELGGNDAAVVLDDADVAVVAPPIFAAATLNAGQVCLAAKRVYAPRAIYDELCNALATLAKASVVGDGLKEGTEIGPIQNRRQFDKVQEYLKDAASDGTIIAGGDVLDRPGYFVSPTVVRDISEDSRLVREEQFGPIIPVLVYDDLEDVITRINAGDFGLGGTVWTSDPERGQQVAMRIDTGTVWVNQHMVLPFEIPFGGVKQSGIGREQGVAGLHEFTQPKIVNVALR